MESKGDCLRSSPQKTDPEMKIPGLLGNIPRKRLVGELGMGRDGEYREALREWGVRQSCRGDVGSVPQRSSGVV